MPGATMGGWRVGMDGIGGMVDGRQRGGGVRGCRTQCYSWAFVLGIFSGHALAAASQQSRSCSSEVLSSSVKCVMHIEGIIII